MITDKEIFGTIVKERRIGIMVIAKEDYEAFYKLRNAIERRTEEIFHLLKGCGLNFNEYYETCNINGDLEFRIGGNYMGEYDHTEIQRPLEYLFMADEEIIKAEEIREKEIEKAKELEEKERQQKIREREIEQLKELKKKYSYIN